MLQSPYFWPSQHHTPDHIEYAIYLYKRAQKNKKIHGLEPGLPVLHCTALHCTALTCGHDALFLASSVHQFDSGQNNAF